MGKNPSSRLIVLGLGALAATLLVSAASAADGPFLSHAPCGYYGWYWGDLYSFQAREATPYFAHHPPVYYSLPVPRTYGYTPFPYPPSVMTPEVLAPVPKVIENRYVPRKAQEQPPADRTASGPLRIVNPYVVQVAEQPAAPLPQVVYPAALAEADNSP